jgi:hypothetical protein
MEELKKFARYFKPYKYHAIFGILFILVSMAFGLLIHENDFFTAEWLNQKTNAKFETLSPENNLARYRVNLDETKTSEIIVFVDAQIGLPVKQEFYSIRDGQRILTSTVELRNFNSAADAKFFEVPKDYRKVSSKEFYEITRREQTK